MVVLFKMDLLYLPHSNSEFLNLLDNLLFKRKIPDIDLNSGPWIAGGCARKVFCNNSLHQSGDIDIFFNNKEQLFSWKKGLDRTWAFFGADSENQPSLQCETENAITYEIYINDVPYKIQMITNAYYKDVEQIFENFDFPACMFAADKNTIVTTQESIDSVQNMTIHRINQFKKETLVQRVAKYHSYGFKFHPSILSRINDMMENEVVKWKVIY